MKALKFTLTVCAMGANAAFSQATSGAADKGFWMSKLGSMHYYEIGVMLGSILVVFGSAILLSRLQKE